MNVLWLCNFIPPVIAKELNLEASVKEGWISGLCDIILQKGKENELFLSVASPINIKMIPNGAVFLKKEIAAPHGSLTFYGFPENTSHPEIYDPALEPVLNAIQNDCKPDLVHCFGTEYPHTLAMCRIFPDKNHILIHIQGLCTPIANAYFANLSAKTIHHVTLRDFLKKDSLIRQQQKFIKRGENEREAVRLAGNIAGRTGMDQYYTHKWNPAARYFKMHETLRSDFYSDRWQAKRCVPHSIFLSQGDYPLKGLHYMLAAMPAIRERFPDAKIYIAGNSIVESRTIKQKLKLSAYGRYLKKEILRYGLKENIFFLGKLSASEMKRQYLKCHLFVCCSSIENSPNSLGEAMMLGMPCVASDVGGIPDLFTENINSVNPKTGGILFNGFECLQNEYGYTGKLTGTEEEKMRRIAGNLSESVISMWEDDRKLSEYCNNARELAERNHNPELNYVELMEIYAKIIHDD